MIGWRLCVATAERSKRLDLLEPRVMMTMRQCLIVAVCGIIGTGSIARPQAVSNMDLMTGMNHGPFVSTTLTDDPRSARGIFVQKGIAVRVSPDAVMVFDTDLLRMARGWSGGFLRWYSRRHSLEQWPVPDGFTEFSTAQRPGWSTEGRFVDSRPRPYGPLPTDQGRYHGLYLHGDKVVFSYRIGDTEVLESPGYEHLDEQPVFLRTLNIEATEETLSLHLLEVPDGPGSTLEIEDEHSSRGRVIIRASNRSRVIAYRGLPTGVSWRRVDRHLVLDLPPLAEPLHCEIAIGSVQNATTAGFVAYLAQVDEVPDLKKWCIPGASRWPLIETQAVMGREDGPFAVDELTIPRENPFDVYFRPSGIDFLPDGRGVVSSLSGDVWLVDGIGEELGTLRWQRFATGLNQPLGVKVVDDAIYVTGRDQITRLHDTNQDGEADYYENFNNEVMAATNFHAFTLNLETDSKGNFYFAKSTPWPPVVSGVKAEITPHHGSLFRVSPDGARLEVIADGLRNPNGMSIGPNDEIVYSDNEGNWVPTSKVHLIKEGGFHGFIPSSHRDTNPRDFVKPIAWIPHFVDNSPAKPIFITSPTWPDALRGQLMLTSYGRGSVALLLNEEVEGQWQSAHLTLPLQLNSGQIRGRFHRDGHLYVGGLTSWQSAGHGGEWGALHRIRYTGQPLHLPVAVRTHRDGLELEFSDPLDPESVQNLENWSLSQWTYPWTSQYGTRGKVYSVITPGAIGPDRITPTAVRLAKDGRTTFLELPGLEADFSSMVLPVIADLPDMISAPLGMVMGIEYNIRAADGTPLEHLLHKTIHRLPGVASPESAMSPTHAAHHATVADEVSDLHQPASEPIVSPPVDGRLVELRSTGVDLSYDVTEIHAKVGEKLTLRFTNASAMVHNIVVVRSEDDITPVGVAALSAHATEFVPSDEMDRILAYSRLAPPGTTVTLQISLTEAGVYPYICTYSGHFSLMQGRIIVTD